MARNAHTFLATRKTALSFAGWNSRSILKPASSMLDLSSALVKTLSFGIKPKWLKGDAIQPTYLAKSPIQEVDETKYPLGFNWYRPFSWLRFCLATNVKHSSQELVQRIPWGRRVNQFQYIQSWHSSHSLPSPCPLQFQSFGKTSRWHEQCLHRVHGGLLYLPFHSQIQGHWTMASCIPLWFPAFFGRFLHLWQAPWNS